MHSIQRAARVLMGGGALVILILILAACGKQPPQTAPQAAAKASPAATASASPAPAAAQTSTPAGTVKLANDYSSYVFSTQPSLRLTELNNSFTGDNNVKQPEQTLLFVLTTDKGQLSAADFKVLGVDQKKDDTGSTATFTLDRAEWEARLSVGVDKTEESHWRLTLKSKNASATQVEVAFPALGGLQIGDTIETNWVHHGLNGGMFYQKPILLRGEGGYSFPLVDVYDISKPGKTGGLYMRAEDLELQTKSFEIQKQVKGQQAANANFAFRPESFKDIFTFNQGVGMAVHYQRYDLEPGATLQMPPASIGAHPGRWEKCWENYRRWVKTWYHEYRPRPQWWREVFAHRSLHNPNYREGDHYPSPDMEAKLKTPEYQDTWDWHYMSGGHYRAAKDIMKPYDDMAVFNQWMAWRGDYDVRADWGGPEPFAKFLADCDSVGTKTSLYMEAVCCEQRSPTAKAHGNEWPVLQNGERYTSEGNLREFNMCAGSVGWRDHIASEVAKVMSQAKPDAIYLDSMALRFFFCEDKTHDHPYRRGWHASVAKTLHHISDAMDTVNPQTPLYLEFWSTDVATQYMSGCNSPVVGAALGMEKDGLPLAPTGTTLFRFYFPDFKLIEICQEDETGLGLSMFNGNGIHCGFRSPEGEALLERYHKIWKQNVDCFTSDDVQPLLETGVADVYMNRFGAGGKQLYTVWNSAKEDKAQVSLPVKAAAGVHAIDVMNGKELALQPGADGQNAVIDLPGRKLAVIALVKPVLTAKREGQRVMIETDKKANLSEGSVEVAVGDKVVTKQLQRYVPINNNDYSLRPMDALWLTGDVDLPAEAPAGGATIKLLVKDRLVDLIKI